MVPGTNQTIHLENHQRSMGAPQGSNCCTIRGFNFREHETVDERYTWPATIVRRAMSLPQEQNANWLERTSFESSSRNGASQNTKRGLPSALKPLALSHVQRGPISTEKMVLSQKTHRIPLNTSVCNSTPSEKDPTLFLALSEQPRDRNCLSQHEAMLSVTRVRETDLFPGKPPRGVES